MKTRSPVMKVFRSCSRLVAPRSRSLTGPTCSSRTSRRKLRDARTTVSTDADTVSPQRNVVVRRSAEKGEFAEPGRELLAVADFDRREVEMLISPTIRGLIAPGMDVMVKAPWGGETMGKIFRMDPEADPATGFFRAIVRLPSECRLIPG
ncbi:HlyD family efflux transporter periplasmic adaptor subunit [Aminivibrio sp.]|uniref:HlyD family efflux transporter periplasmic adaptor subunit n=1 Tax=Aminivibrio sp. TaxID=1872489 RepID=UPI003D9615F0